MKRLLVLLALFALPSLGLAQGSAASGPNATSSAPGGAPTAEQSANCPARPPVAQGAPSGIVLELDADTLWRPRGSEVRFTIRTSGGSKVAAKNVRVCFGWSSPDAVYDARHVLLGSPQVRSVSNDAATEYGAVVPRLAGLPLREWWLRRMVESGRYAFTGAYAVPLADMVVEVSTVDQGNIVTSLQVGVTSVAVGWAVVAALSVLIWLALHRIARRTGIQEGALALRVVSTSDGYASLSQLQIVLWTLVVGLSAVYVMTLSGNLINITPGTLILLGIASASALAARVPGTGPVRPAGPPVAPLWSDLVVPDRATAAIDVTRLQMLAFTLVTAAFVAIKVVVDYEIPDIPATFQVLMGISNGVYVTGRSVPGKAASGDPKGG